MAMESIKGDEFSIDYNDTTKTVAFRGTIRLQTGEDYAPIMDLMQKGEAANAGSIFVLDFRQLNFLNSSGINTISKFVISARKEDRIALSVVGNKDIYWQQKSLQNLQKLWPKVKIDIL